MKKERKTFLLPPDLVEEMTLFQKEKMLGNLTEAAIQLIRMGLEKDKE